MEEIRPGRVTIEKKEEDAQAQVKMWSYMFSFIDMAAMKCIVELRIPDIMEAAGGAMTLPQLTAATACVPSILHRIMRFLVQRCIFEERRECGGGGQTLYALTPVSRCLTKQAMASFFLFLCNQVLLAPLLTLSSYARSGSPPPFVAAHGEDIWSYAAKHAEFSKLLNEAMACDAWNVVPPVLDGCRGMFEGLSTVVDVGGGNGTVLRGLVEACSWIRGINFDLPHVVRNAPECPRIVHVGGDMFSSIPKADAAMLKVILRFPCFL